MMSTLSLTNLTHTAVYSNDFMRLKVTILGNGATGKTSLCRSLKTGIIPNEYEMTVGVNITSKMIGVSGKPVTLILWDLAGQERFDCVRSCFYSGAHAGLIVFDITSRGSFYDVSTWIREFRRQAGNVPFVLIGNKRDKDDGRQREVFKSEAEELAKGYGSIYLETSALNGDNVLEAFQEATRLALQGTAVAW
ncbi:MAG: GTP-binding protein [Candidatus Hodarchaeales archaeon]|jgi:small GTP-binding protein